ncbi:unnamed protein product [Chrysodeixis includens]|uniref:Chitin-binding type-2 domain-containing protein n=1 Tax=Chrysodeixis includens TaxID=689277 RepID=A0A9N8PZ83_CHRIL|nr:unnamed protein product [Chrysodeixis includens]
MAEGVACSSVLLSIMYKLLVLCVIVGGVFADPALFEDRKLPRPPSCRGQKEAGKEACENAVGRLAPHPSECRLFFYCLRSRAICHRCPFGLHFNPSLRVCDWPKNAGCASASTSAAPPSSKSPAPEAPSSPPSPPPSSPPSSPSSPPEEPASSAAPASSEPPTAAPSTVTEAEAVPDFDEESESY